MSLEQNEYFIMSGKQSSPPADCVTDDAIYVNGPQSTASVVGSVESPDVATVCIIIILYYLLHS